MEFNHRLKENRDFRRVFGRGKSTATGRMVLYYLNHNRQPSFRAGFSISKKVGNAVTRNLLKRRLRACMQSFSESLQVHSTDFVIVCRKSAAEATYQELERDLQKLLSRGKFMV